MKVETAKKILSDEITNPDTDLHNPLSNKYARWKIVDYLWACYFENVERGDCLDWLKSKYTIMSENEMHDFVLSLELMCSTIERLSQTTWKGKINL